MAALNREDWNRACQLRIEPKRTCASDVRQAFEGATWRLIEPGGYSDGGRRNDNVTKYAIEGDGDSRVNLAVFEVRKWGYDFRVDLELTLQR